MATERTPLAPSGIASPSYIIPGSSEGYYTAHTSKLKQFQCCICTALLSAFFCALIIAIMYTVNDPIDANLSNLTNLAGLNETDTEIDISAFLSLIDLPLGEETEAVWGGPDVSQKELEAILKEAQRALADKEILEENMQPPPNLSPTYKHQKAVSTTLQARLLGRNGWVEDYATQILVKRHGSKKPSSNQEIVESWSIGEGPPLPLSEPEPGYLCDFNAKFRTANGTCNSRIHPYDWGAAFIPFRRVLRPDYGDGINSPRASVDGQPLPSAREVSLSVHRPAYETDPYFTVMLAVFGQFLDHDITATALNQGFNGAPIECCNVDPKLPLHPECFPVPIGKEDPFNINFNTTCMNFVRSVPMPNGRFGRREQMNQATAFIDGSVVYGNTEAKQRSLRTLQGGKLRMLLRADGKTLLPVSIDPNDGCNQDEEVAKGKYCFDSGDTRSNENLHLTSMHVLWARQHNYIVDKLAALNPHWDDERLFQEGRRILGAQLQHITYNEFLTVVLGKEVSKKYEIISNPGDKADTYREDVNPNVSNNFAAAAFRFAHTLLPRLFLITRDTTTPEGVAMHNMLFNPYSLYDDNGLDEAIYSAMKTPLEKADPYFNDELKNKLFQKPNMTASTWNVSQPCGLDLVSLNIQRGRDHGLPSYPAFRKICNLPPTDTWEQMAKAVDPDSLQRMKEIYRVPQNIDLYTGALSEPPLNGGILGPLFSCVIADTFVRIKRGDRFWFERRVGPQRFTSAQKKQIYGTLLSSIICRNSDKVTFTQRYVMKRSSATNNLEDCTSLDTFDFTPWKEEVGQNEMKKVQTFREESQVLVIQGNGTSAQIPIVNLQKTGKVTMTLADVVIDNNGTVETVTNQVTD